jgi:hypothetical protein
LTRSFPAASRLTVMVLSRLSPFTLSTPALNVAVTAALAEAVVAASTPAAIAVVASSRRVFLLAGIDFLLGSREAKASRVAAPVSLALAARSWRESGRRLSGWPHPRSSDPRDRLVHGDPTRARR